MFSVVFNSTALYTGPSTYCTLSIIAASASTTFTESRVVSINNFGSSGLRFNFVLTNQMAGNVAVTSEGRLLQAGGVTTVTNGTFSFLYVF